MSIQGTLEKYELSEVLLSLSMNQQTGTLTFTRPEGEPIQIYYLKGAIFVIHSEIQSIEELERLLVDARRATSKQMKSALKNKEQTQRFIGDVLVDMNILKEYELINLLQNYIEDTLFSIFIEEEAEFQFELNMAPQISLIPFPSPLAGPTLMSSNVSTS